MNTLRSMLIGSAAIMFAPETGGSLKERANKGRRQQQPKEQEKAGFQVQVTDPIGKYQADEYLSEVRMIVDYFTLHADDDKVRAATPDQIMEVLKATKIEGMTPADANAAYLASILAADFMLQGADDIPEYIMKVAPGSPRAMAVHFGSLVPAELDNALTKAIEAQLDANAGPIVLEYYISKHFGPMKDSEGNPAINNWPVVGTRYQGSKNDRAPYGYSVPKRGDKDNQGNPLPDYNGPWDFYEVDNRSGIGPSKTKGHFVSELVSSTPGGEPWYVLANQLRALKRGATLDGTPQSLIDRLKGHADKIEAELAEASFQFNRRVNRWSTAIKFMQRKAEIKDHFKGRIEVALFDQNAKPDVPETMHTAARKIKPVVFVEVTTSKDPDGTTVRDRARSIPYPMAKVLNLEPRKFPSNASVAAITTVTRGTKGGADKNKDQPGKLAPEIKTTDRLEEYLSAVANYADSEGSYNEIMAKAVSPQDGGQLASAIVMTHAKLTRIANNADIQKLASQYGENAAKSLALANEQAKAKEGAKAKENA